MPSYLHPPVTSSSIKTCLSPLRHQCWSHLLPGFLEPRAGWQCAFMHLLLFYSAAGSVAALLHDLATVHSLRGTAVVADYVSPCAAAPAAVSPSCDRPREQRSSIALPHPAGIIWASALGSKPCQRVSGCISRFHRRVHCAASLQLLHDLATVRGGTAVVAGCISYALFSRYASALPASAPTR